MIAFDLAYELSLGAACALLDRRTAPRGAAGGALQDGLLISGLVYVPICAASAAAWPGWQSMYLVNLAAIPGGAAWLAGLSTAALFACVPIGHAASRAALRRARGRARPVVVALGAGWLALLAVLFGVLWRRAFTVTTHADFHTRPDFAIRWGAPDALLGGPLAAFLLASGLANGAAALWLLRRARRRAALSTRPDPRDAGPSS